MFINKRRCHCQKSQEEVCSILRGSAYGGNFQIQDNHFSLKCSKRNHRGGIMLFRVSGQIIPGESGVDVTLQYDGTTEKLIVIGSLVYGLIYFFIHLLSRNFGKAASGILPIAMGLLMALFSSAEGTEIIDLLEHKLTR